MHIDRELSGFVSAGDKYQILVEVVDTGVTQRSPIYLAFLYRVSAGCLIIIDLDLFLGAVYREIGWCYCLPFFWLEEVALSTVAVKTYTAFLL